MSRRVTTMVGCLVAAGMLLNAPIAGADEIRVLSSVGIKAVLDELTPQFEKTTKHTVTTVFDLASTLKTRIEKGEAFDVAILTPPLLDDLIAQGKVSKASRAEIARVGLGLMIRAGAPRPDVSSVAAFSKTIQNAKSVTYATAGASGIAFLATIDTLGIAAAVKARARPAASGEEVNANILTGVSDLAVLPVSEILPVKGAELGGVFPAEIQTYVVMVAGTNPGTTSSAVRDFVAFLLSPANSGVVKEKGMER